MKLICNEACGLLDCCLHCQCKRWRQHIP